MLDERLNLRISPEISYKKKWKMKEISRLTAKTWKMQKFDKNNNQWLSIPMKNMTREWKYLTTEGCHRSIFDCFTLRLFHKWVLETVVYLSTLWFPKVTNWNCLHGEREEQSTSFQQLGPIRWLFSPAPLNSYMLGEMYYSLN